MKSYLKLFLNCSPALGIVAAVCLIIIAFLGRVSAADTPSPGAIRIMKQIQANQDVIDQTREAHMQFMAAKDANIFDIGQLHSLCYDFDWTKMAPTKIPDCTPDFQ